ncbi:hypothetical protein Tco_1314751 [Tanacetum coccineum]
MLAPSSFCFASLSSSISSIIIALPLSLACGCCDAWEEETVFVDTCVSLGLAALISIRVWIVSSPKFDSLLEELSGELAHIDLISSEIDEADFDPEEEIRLVEKLLYDNSSPRPPKEFNSKNSDAVIESFSPSPIPVEVFNSGILASNEEKSPNLLSYRGFKAFQVISDFSKSPMMIYGDDIPILDVPFLHFYPP